MIYNLPRKKIREETWMLNASVALKRNASFEVKFKVNSNIYSKISVQNINRYSYLLFDAIRVSTHNGLTTNKVSFAIPNEWRTLTFFEPPTGDLLTWLQANAVKQ